ncbi:MAG: ChbG/HpnK family deacetylase [Erysipelotrichaceae bacterium]|nr:ChbG/HpnK family deacetylase [Erysipelotrichaceae bacterium]
MKLMVQADDYGMTYGVTDGIVHAGREGVLTQTGLFTNMPSTEYAVKRWRKEIPHVLLGQDCNLSTGSPVTDPKLIPTLVNEDGTFLTSRQHRARDAENPHNVSYEDAYLEYDNQVKRFIELVGQLPGYIGGHAWHSDESNKALEDIRQKYGVINKYTPELRGGAINMGGWVNPVLKPDKSYDYSITVQVQQDPLAYFVEKIRPELEKRADEDVLVILHTHAGFMDRDLVKLSSFTAVRPMECGLICSKEMRDFVNECNVELVNISQL